MPEALYSPKDSSNPQYLLAHFLMGEIYLKVSNIFLFKEMVNKVQQAEMATWTWNGNLFSLTIDRTSCVFTDFEADPNEDLLGPGTTMAMPNFFMSWRNGNTTSARFPFATY